jgi:hypothetical protein
MSINKINDNESANNLLESIVKKYFFGIRCDEDSLSISVGIKEKSNNGIAHSIHEAVHDDSLIDIAVVEKGSDK